jgi:hypothetical protein
MAEGRESKINLAVQSQGCSRNIARKVAAHLLFNRLERIIMLKKLLVVASSVYAGGVAASFIMMLPFAGAVEALTFGAIWPYVAVRLGIYTLFGV